MNKLNMLLILATTPFFCAASENLVKNGGFESGAVANGIPLEWTLYKSGNAEGGAEILDKFATEGSFCVRIWKSNDSAGSVGLKQNVKLEPDSKYVFHLKGARNARKRWHYVQLRLLPEKKVIFHERLTYSEKGKPIVLSKVEAFHFRTGKNKNVSVDISFGVWGKHDNDDTSIGNIWVDEITLKKEQARPMELKGTALYYFSDDVVSGKLFVNFSGLSSKMKINLDIVGKDGKKHAEKIFEAKQGENDFSINLNSAPPGKYRMIFSAVGPDGRAEDIIFKEFVVQNNY